MEPFITHNPVPCIWFIACTNDTPVSFWHPILQYTPCCARCAHRVGMLTPEVAAVLG